MVFKVTALRFLLIAGCCSIAFSQQSDIVRILTRAANDLAAEAGTKITTGALASGLCFQRSDPTNNKDKCVDQPQGFNFLSYGDAKVSGGVSISAPKPGNQIQSVIKCDAPAGGTAPTCTVGSQNAKASATSVANEKSFTFTQSITVGVSLGVPPLGDAKFETTSSFAVGTSTTETKTETTTDTATAQTAITVQPGDCKLLNITSTPTITTATAEYTVPVNGGISMWFADSKTLPGSENQGNHFNWNPTVGQLVGIAVKNKYAEGLSQVGSNAIFTGKIDINQQKFKSDVVQTNCDGKTATPVSPGGSSSPKPPSNSSPTPPATPKPNNTPAGGGSYTVKSGDTLSSIAQSQGTTVAALQAANPSITNPNQIVAGQSIKVPSTGRRLMGIYA